MKDIFHKMRAEKSRSGKICPPKKTSLKMAQNIKHSCIFIKLIHWGKNERIIYMKKKWMHLQLDKKSKVSLRSLLCHYSNSFSFLFFNAYANKLHNNLRLNIHFGRILRTVRKLRLRCFFDSNSFFLFFSLLLLCNCRIMCAFQQLISGLCAKGAVFLQN